MLILVREKEMRSEELAFEAFEAYQGKIYVLNPRPSTLRAEAILGTYCVIVAGKLVT